LIDKLNKKAMLSISGQIEAINFFVFTWKAKTHVKLLLRIKAIFEHRQAVGV